MSQTRSRPSCAPISPASMIQEALVRRAAGPSTLVAMASTAARGSTPSRPSETARIASIGPAKSQVRARGSGARAASGPSSSAKRALVPPMSPRRTGYGIVDPRLMGTGSSTHMCGSAPPLRANGVGIKGGSRCGHGVEIDPPLLGPAREEAPQRRRAVDPPMRARRLAPDADRDAAALAHRREAALVGEIVTDEDRAASAKGLVLEEVP